MEMYLTTPDRKNLMTRKADIQWGAPQRGVADIHCGCQQKAPTISGCRSRADRFIRIPLEEMYVGLHTG